MRLRLLIWVLWPSFLIAVIAEGIFFAVIHPEEILLFGEPLAISSEGIYTLGFFLIWAFCATSSALTVFVLPKLGERPKLGSDESDLI
jgi:membrane protein DedA with SNARE-associated domain